MNHRIATIVAIPRKRATRRIRSTICWKAEVGAGQPPRLQPVRYQYALLDTTMLMPSMSSMRIFCPSARQNSTVTSPPLI